MNSDFSISLETMNRVKTEILKEHPNEKEFDEIIKKEPKLLFSFPILQREYLQNGERKDIVSLFDDFFTELKKMIGNDIPEYRIKQKIDCQILYYELLQKGIETANENMYREVARRYGILLMNRLFSAMEAYFNLENNKISDEELKRKINSIVRFRNGATKNEISDKLLREGGFVRETREIFFEETKKRKEKFANFIIDLYNGLETEKQYKIRSESEQRRMEEVVDALYFNRFENLMKEKSVDDIKRLKIDEEEIVKVAQILKASKLLEKITNRNYFFSFLSIPDVSFIMDVIERDTDGTVKEMVRRFGEVKEKPVYPVTFGELGRFLAKFENDKDKDEDIKETVMYMEMLNKELEVLETEKK